MRKIALWLSVVMIVSAVGCIDVNVNRPHPESYQQSYQRYFDSSKHARKEFVQCMQGYGNYDAISHAYYRIIQYDDSCTKYYNLLITLQSSDTSDSD